jgi:co-chaperonin GroES (HSP10)
MKAIGANPRLLKPLGNYIVIELFKAEKETMGGVALPDQVVERDRQALARVRSVGAGQRNLMDSTRVGVDVKVDDLIVILKHTPIEIRLAGELCHVICEGDIIAVVDEEELQKIMDEQPVEEPLPEGASVDTETEEAKVVELPSGLLMVQAKDG